MADIGFIGLGHMGMPLAANLVRAGHKVTAFDREPARRQPGAEHGIDVAMSAADAASGRDFVISILPMPADVEAVADEIVGRLGHGVVHIEMSTIDPVTVRRVGERMRATGADMIDAPVTRSVDMAWEGKSALLVGGAPETVERVMPILSAISNLQTYCGPLGNGSAMKLVNNFLAAGILGAVTEALGIALKSGLTLETVMAATERSGTFNKILLEVLPTRAFNGDFSPGFRSALALKDQRLALALAEAIGVDTPLGAVMEKRFADLVETMPDADFTALLHQQETHNGFTARLAGKKA